MTYAEHQFSRYRGGKLLLDSNLLLLFLIGTYDLSLIESFKRLSAFKVDDFEVLRTFMSQFTIFLTTPHLLTEVNGLANSLPEHIRQSWHEHFIRQLALLFEIHEPGSYLVQSPVFLKFGLADAALCQAGAGSLILTEDTRLAPWLISLGLSVLTLADLPRPNA